MPRKCRLALLELFQRASNNAMPVSGDDAQARAKVIALASLIAFDAVDLGPLAAARYLEPFAMTWIHMAFKQGLGRKFAFSVLRRD